MLCGASSPQADVSATITGLRSQKGNVLACLTANPRTFPGCKDDPQARKLTVPVAGLSHLDFGAIPEGRYAISLIHDENGNGRLDTALAIPREGFGFSRDAPVHFGPPSFDKAAFVVGAEPVRLEIRMRYLL
ncbi:DUF2141 domain-containing protein [Novosphingobium sp. BL-8A]|uniref:DUF2141 domain-containing protein n=1 Tax=Novosphingobium sp. BL-8A TaxID=3127639 RepID=UPI003756C26B